MRSSHCGGTALPSLGPRRAQAREFAVRSKNLFLTSILTSICMVDNSKKGADTSFSSHTDISVIVAIQEVKKAYELRGLIRLKVQWE